MQIFDSRYNQINKAEIHCHLEGSIRTQTLIEIAREYGLSLPAYEVEALNPHVKVYDQLKDLQSVLDAFKIAQNSIASPAAVERIAYELFEDADRQNIRLFELRFSPDWAFSGHNLNWDEALQGILRAKERAEVSVRHGDWVDRDHQPRVGSRIRVKKPWIGRCVGKNTSRASIWRTARRSIRSASLPGRCCAPKRAG